MRSSLFWLTDEQWEKIEPLLPTDVRGNPREDDRRVVSGILHVLKSGCRWCGLPAGIRSPEDDLQPLHARGAARHLGEAVPRAGGTRTINGGGRNPRNC